MRTLIIVESPTKAKALRGYLGRDYTVRASMGHVRDLPGKKLGIDLKAGFKPTYHLLPRGRKTIQALRKAIAKVDTIILATDQDREGEAIAWHVVQACRPQLKGKRVLRARFHEITPEAVQAALAQPAALDMNLVNAQQARRILDRLVGYQVSPVLWKAISGPKGLSAGRVQSAALRLVMERDHEIETFVPQEYWTIDAELSRPKGDHFQARLWRIGKDKPALAQQLYEGVKLPGEKTTGLITYMRTDSTTVSPKAAAEAREIIQQFFPDGLPTRSPVYRSKVKNAQEAHEAIRPTSSTRTPKAIRKALTPDQDKLYTLIWRRFIASQMKPAIYNITVVTISTAQDGEDLAFLFRATGRQLLERGFLAVYEIKEKPQEGTAPEQQLPPLARGDALICHKLIPLQHFTKPPPHYTEASLIQTLEKEGIGRPSTFANILDTLYRRQYVTKEKRSLLATSLGKVVGEFLQGHVPAVLDLRFTAQMEDQLDEISNGRAQWQAVMSEMWEPLSGQIEKAESAVAGKSKITVPGYEYTSRRPHGKKPPAKPIGQDCPECKSALVQRKGKHGPFVGCSNYPRCRYTRPLKPENSQTASMNGG